MRPSTDTLLAVLVLVAASAVAGASTTSGASTSSTPPTTLSRYENSTNQSVLYDQGAADGKAHLSGITILDFGRPAQDALGTSATFDFGGHLDPLTASLGAAEGYINGYRATAPAGASMTVLIGTNDSCGTSQPCGNGTCGCSDEPQNYVAWGEAWGRAVTDLNTYAESVQGPAKISAGGADDAEPAYDPAFTNTYAVLIGYSETTALPMVDYGSLDGGPSEGFWTPQQMYSVAYGLLPDQSLPEIYHPGMADQWAALAHWAIANTGHKMTISGVLTESPDGYSPADGYAALLHALADDYQDTAQTSLQWSSNIVTSK